MPPPGATETVDPGKFFWINSAIAPPRGYHDPPMGPVIIFKSIFAWPKAINGTKQKIRPTSRQILSLIFISVPPFYVLSIKSNPQNHPFPC
jgi:hypothetical protein